MDDFLGDALHVCRVYFVIVSRDTPLVPPLLVLLAISCIHHVINIVKGASFCAVEQWLAATHMTVRGVCRAAHAFDFVESKETEDGVKAVTKSDVSKSS